jgi:hydroxymethylbilane synthase
VSHNAHPLRIGSRGSPLALIQSRQVVQQLQNLFPENAAIQHAQIIPVKTTGDQITNRPLSEIGGKGLFARELEQALLSCKIDMAVHSLKDMETGLPDGLVLAAMLKREDARDAFISLRGDSLRDMSAGGSIGTCAPRRIAQIMHLRPDLVCLPMRGNVETRIRKLHDGYTIEGQKIVVDAIVLAMAGMNRLGLQDKVTCIIPEFEMLPAAGQGIITVECRENDERSMIYARSLNHETTERCGQAERALVNELDGSCRTPIGAHAIVLQNGRIKLEALICGFGGSPLYRTCYVGDDPFLVAQHCANALKDRYEPGFREKICVF